MFDNRNMKIGIYTFNITPGKSGGVEQYSSGLIEALVNYTSEDIIVFTNSKLAVKYSHLKEHNNFKIVIIPEYYKYINFAINNIYTNKLGMDHIFYALADIKYINKLTAIADIRNLIYAHKIDVLHVPVQTLPCYFWKIPTLITLHDLQQFYLPQYFTTYQIKSRNIFYKKSAEECTRVIVSFEHVKKDIINFYNISSDKIDVNQIGISDLDAKNVNFNELLKNLGIPVEYILYPAQTWEHKNHMNLLKAIDYINKKYNEMLFLVCTGKKNEFYFKIEKTIKELGIENQVLFTGFVSEEELNTLTDHASLVVIPTLYEAGSFPLLEAMVHKTPVICAETTSLPETIGDDEYVFDPYSVEDLGELIHKILNNPEAIDKSIKNSEKQIKRFQWNVTVSSFIRSYLKAIEEFNN